MNKQQKGEIIESLKDQFNEAQFFYFIDESTLSASKTSNLRRAAYNENIHYNVVKNTLIKKALQASNKNNDELISVLSGPTAVFFSTNANNIAKLIKEFRSDAEKPSLKAAYIDSDIFIGDNELKTLIALKSKEELVGEVIGLLQSPIKNVLGALQSSSGQKIAGLLKTIEEKNN
jgi:large subunit ribosomal protein L10